LNITAQLWHLDAGLREGGVHPIWKWSFPGLTLASNGLPQYELQQDIMKCSYL
jgi:hypothetical protein